MMELSDIVRQVVRDYFADKHKCENKNQIAILLEYESMYVREIWGHLRNLSERYQLHLILGEAWREVPLDLQHIERIELCREQRAAILDRITFSDLLYIPNSSFAMLTKLALTIDDDLASWILIQMQLSGKPILMLDDWLLPVGKQSLAAPPKLLDKIRNYQKQLRDEGVHFSNRLHVERWLKNHQSKPSKRNVILARHIEECVQNGIYEWQLTNDEIITPLARDRARELDLQFRTWIDQEVKEGRS